MAKISASPGGIVIIVKDQHNSKLFFNMKRDIPLRKLLVAYCNKRNVDYRTVTLVLNGDRVRPDQTPEELKMENNDEIDVMSPMTGGGCYL